MLGQRRDEAEALYRRSMMIHSAAELTVQLEASVCLRYTALRTIVDRGRAHLLPHAARSRVVSSPFAPAATEAAVGSSSATLDADLVQVAPRDPVPVTSHTPTPCR